MALDDLKKELAEADKLICSGTITADDFDLQLDRSEKALEGLRTYLTEDELDAFCEELEALRE